MLPEKSALSVFSDYLSYYTCNLEFFLGFNRFIVGVCRNKGHASSPFFQIFHGPLTVNLCNNNIPAFGNLPLVNKHHVPGKNARFGHGIPGYLKETCAEATDLFICIRD